MSSSLWIGLWESSINRYILSNKYLSSIAAELSLKLDADVDGGDTESQVLVAFAWDIEPGLSDHVGEGLLVRKLSNAFHQVLVGISVVSDELAHHWQKRKGVNLVEVIKGRLLDLGEFQAGEDSSWLQDSVRGVEAGLDVGEVSDTESNGVDVLRVVWNGVHRLSVLFEELDPWGVGVWGGKTSFSPSLSMSGLMSATVIVDLLSPYFNLAWSSNPKAMSPVPPATSKKANGSPEFGLIPQSSFSIKCFFHNL